MKKIRIAALLLPLIVSLCLLPACRSKTYRVAFREIDRDRQMKQGSIAVIAGSAKGFDALLALSVAEKLSYDSVLTVLPPREVARLVPGYPVEIMDQFSKRAEKRQAPDILSDTESSRLSAIQARLSTDYVLAVWGTQLEKVRIVRVPTGFVNYSYCGNIHARLIEYPSGTVLGYSRFRNENFVDRGRANYAVRTKKGEDVFLEHLADSAADRIVSRFLRGYGRNVAKK